MSEKSVGFVIWGIGERGTRVFEACKPFVKAIIDKNYAEPVYHNVPLITVEEYFAQYKEYPILITPKGHECEIEDELKKYGSAEHYFYMPEGVYLRMAQYINNPDWLLPANTDGKVYICGSIVESSYTAHVLNNGNIQNERISENDFVELVSKGKVSDNDSLYAINSTISTVAYSLLESKSITVRSINDFWDNCNLFSHVNMQKYRGTHNGESCFIVATGPSLKHEDLQVLKKNKCCCFSCNRMILLMDELNWTPDYFVLSDGSATEYAIDNLLKEHDFISFISDNAWIDRLDNCEKIEEYHLDYVERSGLPRFSENAEIMYAGKTVTYVMLQLAVFMGFSKIYLLGVDCNYIRGGANNYFMGDGSKDDVDHETVKMLQAYKSAKEYADKHGIKILNATRGGMLEVFERVDFDSIFENK